MDRQGRAGRFILSVLFVTIAVGFVAWTVLAWRHDATAAEIAYLVFLSACASFVACVSLATMWEL